MRRTRLGEPVAAAGGLALLLTMFLTWYEGPAGAGGDAWHAFAVIDVILTLLAFLALVLAVLTYAQRTPALPVAAAVVTAVCALLAALLVLYRLIDQPGPNEAVEVRSGAWLGLLAVLVIAAGAWRSIGDESPGPAESSTVPIERRPAPPPAPPAA